MSMWRIVCTGPGPQDKLRRVTDRGPLHGDRQRTLAMAAFLRSTGLHESVKVVSSSVAAATVGAVDAAEAAFDADAVNPAAG
ncbi:MAG: hypothetical protein Q7T55_22380 [Solirubrobacteraceae bacterium]|nr:hypothetical protein [Solirubrobacteraceae bacterium]